MRNFRASLWIIASIYLLLSSCAQPQTTHYFLLDFVPQPTAARLAKGPWPHRVRIKDFSIAEAYHRDQMVYRQSAHELRFYNYELWAVKPEVLVSDMIFQQFRDAHLFMELTRSVEQEESEYILRGEITAIEEYDNVDQWYAHLAMSMSLQDSKTLAVVWSQTWDYRKKVAQQEPVFVVRELSVLLEKIGVEATDQLDAYFAKLPTTIPESSQAKDSDLPTPDTLPPPTLTP